MAIVVAFAEQGHQRVNECRYPLTGYVAVKVILPVYVVLPIQSSWSIPKVKAL